MGRARKDWRKREVTSRTRGGAKEFKLFKAHGQKLTRDGKLPTQLEVSLAVSFELRKEIPSVAIKKLDTTCDYKVLILNSCCCWK